MTKIKTTPLALALMFALCPTVSMAQAPSPQACGGVMLDVCPTPYDPVLPAAKDMLNWDQTSRYWLSQRLSQLCRRCLPPR
jgi:hypothetical protein